MTQGLNGPMPIDITGSAIRILLLGSLIVACHASISGCAGSPPPARILYDDADRFVRLEVTDASTHEQRDHPTTLHSADLAKILRGVKARPRAISPQGTLGYAAKPGPQPDARAFDDEIVSFLSTQVVQALKQATPLEDVLFYLDLPRDDRIIEIISGSVYARNKELHLLLANYRHPTIGDADLQNARANPLTVIARPGYELDPRPFGKVHRPSGLAAVMTEKPQHLIFPFDGFPERPSSRAGKPAAQSDLKDASAEKRLRRLKHLREENLISEEEYRKVKAKILSEY